jgi:hypothetical protein
MASGCGGVGVGVGVAVPVGVGVAVGIREAVGGGDVVCTGVLVAGLVGERTRLVASLACARAVVEAVASSRALAGGGWETRRPPQAARARSAAARTVRVSRPRFLVFLPEFICNSAVRSRVVTQPPNP